MPPNFQQEGIEAARQIRKRHPGTGVVILSQFDDPEYAISLLDQGAAGCAYLLKDRIAEGDQLVRAVRTVVSGGSVLDPVIVEAMVHPASSRLPEGKKGRPWVWSQWRWLRRMVPSKAPLSRSDPTRRPGGATASHRHGLGPRTMCCRRSGRIPTPGPGVEPRTPHITTGTR